MLIPASVLVKALSFCACFVLLQPHERTKLEHRARPTRLRVASWVMGLNTKAIGVGIHSPNDFAFLNMSSFGNKKCSPPCPSFTYHLSPLHHSLLIALLNCFLITLIQDLYLRLLLRSLLRCLLFFVGAIKN